MILQFSIPGEHRLYPGYQSTCKHWDNGVLLVRTAKLKELISRVTCFTCPLKDTEKCDYASGCPNNILEFLKDGVRN